MRKLTGIFFHVLMVAGILWTTGPVGDVVKQVQDYPVMAGITLIITVVVMWMGTNDLKWC